MRHAQSRSRLNRFTSWQRATVGSLARNLLIYESIKTTLVRAKAVQPLAEKLISLAKQDTLSAKRRAFAILGDHKLVSRLFKEIGPRFSKRTSGFTRIISLGCRRGDNAKVVIFELLEKKVKETKKPKKVKEVKPEAADQAKEISEERPSQETKSQDSTAVKEKPPVTQKPTKKFLGGLRGIFKKERDSL
ncbi:MAG: 50S ribosomal protein L17 [Candidatus Omnitrophica bacterium]|nr:50S ribosomal protein L17 [Candidatus Omnitrophota bacterium]MBU1869181.1 50S ribosomal protein L17 [Candidatus Omnitrophota bacterium]